LFQGVEATGKRRLANGGKKRPDILSKTPKNMNESKVMAEGVGFEPTVPLQARRFSRPVP